MQSESNPRVDRPRSGGITVVIPVFNEVHSIRKLWDEMAAVFKDWDGALDFVFVDDGSTDGSEPALDGLVRRNSDNVTAIHLRGNFGETAALAAGFARARNDVIVTLDADLQDDPAEIPRFVDAIDSGLDLVCGYKKERNDPFRRVVASRIFNWLVRVATGTHLHDVNCGFKALRREVVDEIPLYGELHRFIPVLAVYRGFSETAFWLFASFSEFTKAPEPDDSSTMFLAP